MPGPSANLGSLLRRLPLPGLLMVPAAPVLVGVGVAAHLHSASAARSLGALGVALSLGFGLRGLAGERLGAGRSPSFPPGGRTLGLPRLSLISLLIALAIGVWLAASSAWWLLAVGAAATLVAAGSTRYAVPPDRGGLGTLVVVAAGELLAGWGTVWVEAGHLPLLGLVAALLPASLAVALLLLSDLRDQAAALPQISARGRLSPARARRAVRGLLGLALAVPLLITVPGLAGAECFLPWLVAPLAEGPLGGSSTADEAKTGRAVTQLKLLLVAASALLAIGIWAG